MTRTIRMAGFQFAFIAMLLRALLPAGWMPDASGHSLFTICSVVSVDNSDKSVDGKSNRHLPGQDDGRTHEMCAHAGATHFVPPVTKLTIAPPSSIANAAATQLANTRSFDGACYLQPSPRAPPSLT